MVSSFHSESEFLNCGACKNPEPAELVHARFLAAKLDPESSTIDKLRLSLLRRYGCRIHARPVVAAIENREYSEFLSHFFTLLNRGDHLGRDKLSFDATALAFRQALVASLEMQTDSLFESLFTLDQRARIVTYTDLAIHHGSTPLEPGQAIEVGPKTRTLVPNPGVRGDPYSDLRTHYFSFKRFSDEIEIQLSLAPTVTLRSGRASMGEIPALCYGRGNPIHRSTSFDSGDQLIFQATAEPFGHGISLDNAYRATLPPSIGAFSPGGSGFDNPFYRKAMGEPHSHLRRTFPTSLPHPIWFAREGQTAQRMGPDTSARTVKRSQDDLRDWSRKVTSYSGFSGREGLWWLVTVFDVLHRQLSRQPIGMKPKNLVAVDKETSHRLRSPLGRVSVRLQDGVTTNEIAGEITYVAGVRALEAAGAERRKRSALRRGSGGG